MNRIVKTRKESRDSDKFICKTNDDVNEWMDTFYVEGRNAPFNLHCLWAWQEQERRHGELIAEVERLSFREKMLSEYGCEYCAGSGHVHRIDGYYLGVCDSCSAYEFNCAKHEIEKLKNENESLKKDAARYRTIKKDAISDGSLIERLDCNVRPSEWDSYIDSVSVK